MVFSTRITSYTFAGATVSYRILTRFSILYSIRLMLIINQLVKTRITTRNFSFLIFISLITWVCIINRSTVFHQEWFNKIFTQTCTVFTYLTSNFMSQHSFFIETTENTFFTVRQIFLYEQISIIQRIAFVSYRCSSCIRSLYNVIISTIHHSFRQRHRFL